VRLIVTSAFVMDEAARSRLRGRPGMASLDVIPTMV
jgi:hypothetical protein